MNYRIEILRRLLDFYLKRGADGFGYFDDFFPLTFRKDKDFQIEVNALLSEKLIRAAADGDKVALALNHEKISEIRTEINASAGLDAKSPTLNPLEYDIFISYAAGDSALAQELRVEFEQNTISCFMAEKDIPVATEWQQEIRKALSNSRYVLLLLTPRSIDRPWVLIETGAAWVLDKKIIPALVQVTPDKLVAPVARYQARVIETAAQRQALIAEVRPKRSD